MNPPAGSVMPKTLSKWLPPNPVVSEHGRLAHDSRLTAQPLEHVGSVRPDRDRIRTRRRKRRGSGGLLRETCVYRRARAKARRRGREYRHHSVKGVTRDRTLLFRAPAARLVRRGLLGK